jgi:hypothetical protein
MPTSTDLVTDLPADFETFGQAVDTSLADLKGGTSGQVLSKASNTDMDFTWVTSDDANAIQNTIVDAKGDLISATGSDVPARLAVGNNGETLVADSSTSTGLRYQGSLAAGKNACINGGFDIWQRGTSVALVASASNYTADRWVGYSSNTGTVSRQATGDTTNLPFIQYCARVQRTSGQTGTAIPYLVSSFESVNSIPYAGKTISFSFYARAGANYSSASSALSIFLAQGSGTDQTIINGFTSETRPIAQNITLTTTWQRFTYSTTLPGTTTQLGVGFYYTPSGTAGAADYFEVTGIQIEVGAVATQFSRAGATIQGELAACQRYYYRTSGSANYQALVATVATTATAAQAVWYLPVTMRIASTDLTAGALYYEQYDGAGATAATVTASGSTRTSTRLSIANITGQTAGRAGTLFTNNDANSYIALNAEL